MSAVEARSLSIGHAGRACASGIEFRLDPGELLAVLGPNGSGKTTLLDTVAGVVPPVAGQALVCGKEPAGLGSRERARLAAFVPQDEPRDHGLTSSETVALGRFAYGRGPFDGPDDLERARAALEQVGAGALAGRPVSGLSAGERQRVLLARALAQDTPLLLADEPTANLDPVHQGTAGRLLQELARQGKAVMVATHDLHWASCFADRALVLANGGQHALGAASEVLRPETLEDAFGSRFGSNPGGHPYADFASP